VVVPQSYSRKDSVGCVAGLMELRRLAGVQLAASDWRIARVLQGGKVTF
jgi:hypothetical protein